MDAAGLAQGKRVRVKLSYDKYSGRSAGTYRGEIEYVKGGHVGIWVPWKGYAAGDGFLTGAARMDGYGTWIEGR
ncbi:hypothetical protein [Streptomyces vinaceus]|uniref:hypothetical protein n=1 Tax=Streptomyces vinaceus TaxID=1960 RepID=UPI0036BC0CF7